MSSERMAEIQSGRSGVGIGGMRERLRQFLEGTMNIESDSSGTRIFRDYPAQKVHRQKYKSKTDALQLKRDRRCEYGLIKGHDQYRDALIAGTGSDKFGTDLRGPCKAGFVLQHWRPLDLVRGQRNGPQP